MTEPLKDILALAEIWPDWAQRELCELALEIDREVKAGTYQATRAELEKIDEALAAVRHGEIAGEDEIEAVFEKHRAP